MSPFGLGSWTPEIKEEHSKNCLKEDNSPFGYESVTYAGNVPPQDIRFKVKKRNPTDATKVIQNIITIESEIGRENVLLSFKSAHLIKYQLGEKILTLIVFKFSLINNHRINVIIVIFPFLRNNTCQVFHSCNLLVLV